MVADRAARVAKSDEDFALALDLDLGFRESRDVRREGAGPPLSCFAMANADHQRLALGSSAQQAARALSKPLHRPASAICFTSTIAFSRCHAMPLLAIAPPMPPVSGISRRASARAR